MKRICWGILALILLGMRFTALADSMHEVVYFYESYCESCTPEEEFEEYFLALTGKRLGQCAFEAYNIVSREGQQALDAVKERYKIDEVFLPMAIVDGTVYAGTDALERELPVTALSWGETTDSVVLYLYVPACESCARAVAILDVLPEKVVVRRGELEYESTVRVEKMDASANTALADALFDAYAVPDRQRITPCVFIADRYLSGIEDIEQYLPTLVNIGRASGGTLSIDLEKSEVHGQTTDVLATLGAGLIAGLNTCALSMLLLFLAMILEAKRRAGLLCICFLTAKFVCYLLIGFVFLEVLQRVNPLWLRPLARIVLTVFGVAFIGLNVWDAWQIRREHYGKVRNQLPPVMRSKLHHAIRTMTSSAVLIPAVIALGFIVALGEFLCAGQLYLMRLLYGVQEGQGGCIHLVLYCVAFIIPSAVVCAVVLKGCSRARVSAFFARHMMAIKLLTAASVLLLTVTAWMI